jgi:hypothetical protein
MYYDTLAATIFSETTFIQQMFCPTFIPIFTPFHINYSPKFVQFAQTKIDKIWQIRQISP